MGPITTCTVLIEGKTFKSTRTHTEGSRVSCTAVHKADVERQLRCLGLRGTVVAECVGMSDDPHAAVPVRPKLIDPYAPGLPPNVRR